MQAPEDGYELVPHRYGVLKGIPWRVCIYCGHVAFTTPLALWVHKVGCDSRWHPDYRRMLRVLPKQHQERK